MLINPLTVFFAFILMLIILLLIIPNKLFSTRTCLRQSSLILLAVACLVGMREIYQATFIIAVIGSMLLWYDWRCHIELGFARHKEKQDGHKV